MTFYGLLRSGDLSKIVEILWLPALLLLLSGVFLLLLLGQLSHVGPRPLAPVPPVPVAVPTVSGEVIGPAQPVFENQDACEAIDIPDAPARAFRDDHDIVHLIASHYVARAMVGTSLDELKRDCRVIYTSPQDPDPSHFQDKNWLFSFYTTDGRRIAALVHSEYDAMEIPSMCATPEEPTNCWWNTVTFAESLDGGHSFRIPAPPRNLVAALPYRYEVGNRANAYGYTGPTNIHKIGGFYYALINDWPYKAQDYGPCLIRTADVFDPQSWRAWDGKNFTVRFADPYRETIAKPEEHICAPVLAGGVGSLVQHAPSGNFIVTQFVPDDRFGGPPGFYIQASHDLEHWSTPSLLVKFSDLLAADAHRNRTYGYESLLDPTSGDRNFSTVSDTPYLYYVGTDPGYGRTLFRRKIKLHVGK